MFAALPLHAIQDNRLGLSDLRILASVASFASPSKPVCWPSRSAIGQRCSIRSESRVSKHLHRLQSFGWLEITPRQGSNLYRILNGHTAAPEQTCTPCSTSAVHPAMHANQTIEQTIVSSPSPLALATSATRIEQERQQAAAAARQQHQKQQQARQQQRDQEREARQARHQQRQERREQRREQRQANPSPARSEAVQRLLEVFKTHCGVEFPSEGATARTIERRIDEYGEQTLARIIEAKGPSFRIPTALLRPDLIESISAELSRPTPAPTTPGDRHQEKPREKRWFGIPESVIVKHAMPGESFEDCAYRLLDEQRRSGTLRA